jgi:hypothetical protein
LAGRQMWTCQQSTSRLPYLPCSSEFYGSVLSSPLDPAQKTAWSCRMDIDVIGAVISESTIVNAGEKMHQRAGVKLHHGWMPNAPTGGLLLRDKQDEKCVASPANVPETSSVG